MRILGYRDAIEQGALLFFSGKGMGKFIFVWACCLGDVRLCQVHGVELFGSGVGVFFVALFHAFL